MTIASKNNTNTQRQEDITRQLANEFISALSEESLPWRSDFNRVNLFPQNPASGTVYQGTTKVILMIKSVTQEYNDPRWMTFKQAKMLDAQVMKGEKATMCVHWQPIKIADKDKDGNIILDEEGKEKTKEILIPCPYALFNVKQIKGLTLPPLEVSENITWDPNERAETLITNSKAIIKNDLGIVSPFYSLKSDEINMPTKAQFNSPNAYYDTLLHEMCHWTGHESRMNRLKSHNIITEDYKEEYAREELRAEIGSSILSLTLGIDHKISGNDHDLNNHKAYVKSWIQALDNNPKEILYATAQADKIVSYLRQYDPIKDPQLIPLLSQNQYKNLEQENKKIYISQAELPKIKQEIKDDIKQRIEDAVDRDKLSYTLEPIANDNEKIHNFCANFKSSTLPSTKELQQLSKKENVRRINLSDGKVFLSPDSSGNFYEINFDSLSKPDIFNLANKFMSKDDIKSIVSQHYEQDLSHNVSEMCAMDPIVNNFLRKNDYKQASFHFVKKLETIPKELQDKLKSENVKRINLSDKDNSVYLADALGTFRKITPEKLKTNHSIENLLAKLYMDKHEIDSISKQKTDIINKDLNKSQER